MISFLASMAVNWLSIYQHVLVYPPSYLPTYLSILLFIYLSLSTYLPTYHLNMFSSIYNNYIKSINKYQSTLWSTILFTIRNSRFLNNPTAAHRLYSFGRICISILISVTQMDNHLFSISVEQNGDSRSSSSGFPQLQSTNQSLKCLVPQLHERAKLLAK